MDYSCSCGKDFQGPPGYTGDLCQCPYCGAIVSLSGDAPPIQQPDLQEQIPTEVKKAVCPKCSSENSIAAEICHKCGYTIKVYQKTPWLESCLISAEAGITLVIGLAMALGIVFGDLKFLRFIAHHFITLVHEFGHALCSWLFGYFAVPAFDFTHGGGVTLTDHEMNIYIRIGVYVVLAWLLYLFKNYKMILCGLGTIIGALAFSQLMNWDQLAILYMGHGTVAVMGGLFLFRGLSNIAVHHIVERVLYFFLAFFVLIEEFMFSRKVINNPGFREMYLEGKGGVANDFHRIGDHLHLSVENSIAFHSTICIAVPIVTYIIYILAMRNYTR